MIGDSGSSCDWFVFIFIISSLANDALICLELDSLYKACASEDKLAVLIKSSRVPSPVLT